MQRKRTVTLLVSIAFVTFLIVELVILFTDKNIKFNELLTDYNELNHEHQQLLDDYENLIDAQKAITEKADVKSKEKDSFIQRYSGMKYPVKSGLRRFIGEEPLRIYPSSKAPFTFEDYKPNVVEIINEVGIEQGTWCLVLDSRGVSGYAQRSDLKPINSEEDNFADYGSGIETLGGFKTGERIETLIGLLERDYYLIYENGRIYEFPDNQNEEKIDPIERPFSNIKTLDAFVRDTNRLTRLRTNSPKFPLKDGFKVGDNAMKVLDFYESKYQYLDKPELKNMYSKYTFVIENGHMLEFSINTKELNQNSVISSINID